MRYMHAIELSELLVHSMSPIYYAAGYVCFIRTFSVPCGTTRHNLWYSFSFLLLFLNSNSKNIQESRFGSFYCCFLRIRNSIVFVVFKCLSHIIVVPLLRSTFSSRITPRWKFLIYLCPIQGAQLLESKILIRSIFSSTWPLCDD